MPFLIKTKAIGLILFITFILSSCSSPPPINVMSAKTALGIDEKLMPIEATSAFSDGTKKIFCWFQWQGAKVPMTITARWTFATDNVHILDYNFEIPRKDGFGGISLVMPEGKKLPLGQYKVDLLFGEKVLKSTTFSIDLAQVSYFQISGPKTMTAGSTQSLTITAFDRFGNMATGYNGPHSLVFSGVNQSPDGTTPQVDGVTLGNGVNVNFTSGISDPNSVKLTPYRAEGTTINVSAEGNKYNSTGHGLVLTVTPADPSQLAFVHGPSHVVAGQAINPPITVQIKDAYGNPRVEDNSTTVTLALKDNPGSALLSGSLSQKARGGIATFNDVSVNKAANSYTLVALAGPLSSMPSGAFNAIPTTAQYLTITGTSSMTAGGTNELTIKAYDAFDNLATSYSGAKTLTFSGPSASPNGTSPTVEGVKVGEAVTINFTDGISNANAATLSAFNAEESLINASDGAIDSKGHGLNVNVAASANDNLTFLQGPTNAPANKLIVPSVKVQIRDIYNNIKKEDNNTSVTIALKENPRNAKLSGTLTQSSVAGMVVFDDLSLNKIANGYVLKAISQGLTETISEAFNIEKK